MGEEKISQKFRLTIIQEIKKHFIKEIDQVELMSKQHKVVSKTLNYIEQFILASAITGCVSTFTFTSLLGIPIGVMSSAIGLKFCAITTGIKKV